MVEFYAILPLEYSSIFMEDVSDYINNLHNNDTTCKIESTNDGHDLTLSAPTKYSIDCMICQLVFAKPFLENLLSFKVWWKLDHLNNMTDLIIRITSKRLAILDNINANAKEQINEKTIKIIGVSNEEKRIQDVFRYTISVSNNGISHSIFTEGLEEFNDKPTDASENSKIVLVIESPHKDEYTDNFSPKAPAQGKTGEKIASHIDAVVAQLSVIQPGNYDLIIVNPVQFQASLYHLHRQPLTDNIVKGIRNAAWRSLYRNGEKDRFINRINNYNPVVIVNACTHGLRKEVTTTLLQNIRNTAVPIFECTHHPCMWDKNFSLAEVHR